MAVGIRADDHLTVVVLVQIGDLMQQGDALVAGGETLGLSYGGDSVPFELAALGGIKRHVRPP